MDLPDICIATISEYLELNDFLQFRLVCVNYEHHAQPPSNAKSHLIIELGKFCYNIKHRYPENFDTVMHMMSAAFMAVVYSGEITLKVKGDFATRLNGNPLDIETAFRLYNKNFVLTSFDQLFWGDMFGKNIEMDIRVAYSCDRRLRGSGTVIIYGSGVSTDSTELSSMALELCVPEDEILAEMLGLECGERKILLKHDLRMKPKVQYDSVLLEKLRLVLQYLFPTEIDHQTLLMFVIVMADYDPCWEKYIKKSHYQKYATTNIPPIPYVEKPATYAKSSKLVREFWSQFDITAPLFLDHEFFRVLEDKVQLAHCTNLASKKDALFKELGFGAEADRLWTLIGSRNGFQALFLFDESYVAYTYGYFDLWLPNGKLRVDFDIAASNTSADPDYLLQVTADAESIYGYSHVPSLVKNSDALQSLRVALQVPESMTNLELIKFFFAVATTVVFRSYSPTRDFSLEEDHTRSVILINGCLEKVAELL